MNRICLYGMLLQMDQDTCLFIEPDCMVKGVGNSTGLTWSGLHFFILDTWCKCKSAQSPTVPILIFLPTRDPSTFLYKKISPFTSVQSEGSLWIDAKRLIEHMHAGTHKAVLQHSTFNLAFCLTKEDEERVCSHRNTGSTSIHISLQSLSSNTLFILTAFP